MEFKEWLIQQELEEGFADWLGRKKKLLYPLAMTAGLMGKTASASNPYNINVPPPPSIEFKEPEPELGIKSGRWKSDFENIAKSGGQKPFPHDSSYKALHSLKKQALADPEFFKNLEFITQWMHGTEFRKSMSKLSGFKNIPGDTTVKDIFNKMWSQYKNPELKLTKDPFYKSYSEPKSVAIGTDMSGEEDVPMNPYMGTSHEYIHQTQGQNNIDANVDWKNVKSNDRLKYDYTDVDAKELCELPTCLGDGIWILMAAQRQAKAEGKPSPFIGKTIQLPNGKNLRLDFLANQAEKFNAFENPAKLTHLLASPTGIAWLKSITSK